MVDGHGGCMNMGGICIGCTMPGFPDKFSPIYEIAPGVAHFQQHQHGSRAGSSAACATVSRVDKNMTVRWDKDAPSGWARAKTGPRGSVKMIHKFYSAYQHSHEGGVDYPT